MKKIYLILVCMMTLVLGGCRFTKEEPVANVPTVIIPENEEPTVIDDMDDDVDEEDDGEEPIDDDTHEDELDEDGEFDPKKFEDEDIDEIMDLMKELIAE